MNDILNGFVLYGVFLFSTTLHEAAHAWAAKLGGDLTAYKGGQVTMDPVPHIRREPIGMVLMPILCVIMFGWPLGFASAPYDPHWAVNHPRRAGWMALAGPGANFLLLIIAGLLIRVGVMTGTFYPPHEINFADLTAATAGVGTLWHGIGYCLGAFFALNLLLCVFNLLPLPPMDGSAAVVLTLPGHLVHRYQEFIWSNPQLSLFGMFIAWSVFGRVFDPIFTFSLNVLYPGASYSSLP